MSTREDAVARRGLREMRMRIRILEEQVNMLVALVPQDSEDE